MHTIWKGAFGFCVFTQKKLQHPGLARSRIRTYIPSQLPRQVTVTDSTLMALLPVEFAWWFVWRCGWAPAGWILVLSNRAELVAGLAVRAAAGVNIVWGVTRADTAMEDLAVHQTEVMRLITICDGLPPVRWTQGCTRTISALD